MNSFERIPAASCRTSYQVVMPKSSGWRTNYIEQASVLLQGPDLTNNPTGVLCRFWQEHIAFMCDIQAKFRQVKVDVEHCNLLTFLWWEKPERKGDPVEAVQTLPLKLLWTKMKKPVAVKQAILWTEISMWMMDWNQYNLLTRPNWSRTQSPLSKRWLLTAQIYLEQQRRNDSIL